MRAGLELEGRMLDRHGERLDDAVLELVEKSGGMPIGEALISEDDVGGQDGKTRGDLVSVQIMNVENMGD